jgi:hypothetical protein
LQELLFSLGCAHVYHDECIGQYATVKGMGVNNVPCPTCKYTPSDPVVVDADAGRPSVIGLVENFDGFTDEEFGEDDAETLHGEGEEDASGPETGGAAGSNGDGYAGSGKGKGNGKASATARPKASDTGNAQALPKAEAKAKAEPKAKAKAEPKAKAKAEPKAKAKGKAKAKAKAAAASVPLAPDGDGADGGAATPVAGDGGDMTDDDHAPLVAEAKGKAKGKAKGTAKAKPKARASAPGDDGDDGDDDNADSAGDAMDNFLNEARGDPALAKAKGKAKGKANAKAKAKGKAQAVPKAKATAKAAAVPPAPGVDGGNGDGGQAAPDGGDGDGQAGPDGVLVPAGDAAAAAADEGIMMTGGWSDDVYCSSCRTYCSFKRCRVLSKHAATWRCHSCNTKVSQLRRIHETWPTGAFLSLTEDSQTARFNIKTSCCLATSSLYDGVWGLCLATVSLCVCECVSV